MVKKFLSFLLAVSMIFSSAVCTFAADDIVMKENDTEEKITFTDLVSAVKSATDNKVYTITLNTDCYLTEQLVIRDGQKIILDLNGHSIKNYPGKNFESGIIAVYHGAELTITDTSTPTSLVTYENYGVLLKAGKIRNESEFGAGIVLCPPEDTQSDVNKPAKLHVVNGTINGEYYGILGKGSTNGKNAEILIDGGWIQANKEEKESYGIFNSQENGKVIINNGIIVGNSAAIEMRSGSLTVNGGYIWNLKDNPIECKSNTNGPTTKGAAIAVSQNGDNHPLSVTITGGTIEGYSGKTYSLFEKDVQDETYTDISLSITGGTFKGKVSSTDCEGFISGGNFTDRFDLNLLKDNYSLMVGSNYYSPYKIANFVTVETTTDRAKLVSLKDTKTGKDLTGIDVDSTHVKVSLPIGHGIKAVYTVSDVKYQFESENYAELKNVVTDTSLEAPEVLTKTSVLKIKLDEHITSKAFDADSGEALEESSGVSGYKYYSIPYGTNVKVVFTAVDAVFVSSTDYPNASEETAVFTKTNVTEDFTIDNLPRIRLLHVLVSHPLKHDGIKKITVTNETSPTDLGYTTDSDTAYYSVLNGSTVKVRYEADEGYLFDDNSKVMEINILAAYHRVLNLPKVHKIPNLKLTVKGDYTNVYSSKALDKTLNKELSAAVGSPSGQLDYSVEYGDVVELSYIADPGYAFEINTNKYVIEYKTTTNALKTDTTVTLPDIVWKYYTLTIPSPSYEDLTYEVLDKTENEELEPAYSKNGNYIYLVEEGHKIYVRFTPDSGYELENPDDKTYIISSMTRDRSVPIPDTQKKVNKVTITIPSGIQGITYKVYDDTLDKELSPSTTLMGSVKYSVTKGDDIRIVITPAKGYKFEGSKEKTKTISYDDIYSDKTVTLPKVVRTTEGENDNPNTGIEDHMDLVLIVFVSIAFTSAMAASLTIGKKKKIG